VTTDPSAPAQHPDLDACEFGMQRRDGRLPHDKTKPVGWTAAPMSA
jgi:hypothetical protein